jgi:ABC-2 type transport system permease protein
MVIMHVSGPLDDPVFGRDYGRGAAVAILLLWTVASLLGGYLVLRRRDA